MSGLQVAVLAGIGTVVATWLAVTAVRPQRRRLAAVMAAHYLAPAPRPEVATSPVGRLGASLASTPAGQVVAARWGRDLLALGGSVPDLLGRMVVGAAVAATVVVVDLSVLAVLGLGAVAAPLALPAVALGAAFGAWWPLGQLRSGAARRRRDLRAQATDVVSLVAIALPGRPDLEALWLAARLGQGPGFSLMADVAQSAHATQRPVWEVLGDTADAEDLPALGDLARLLEVRSRMGVGAGADQRVAALAERLRQQGLDELERAADKANANLSIPTIGFVVGMVLFLAFPIAISVSGAFGA